MKRINAGVTENEKMQKNIFSFDAETNGLWGQAFAIGAILYDPNGGELTRFVGRCPIEGAVNKWVEDNVLPQMTDVPVTHKDYESMLADFAKFYMANKTDAEVVVHMGVPVESKLLIDMHARGFIGDWDGPCPLFDVVGNLQQVGEDPTSVDAYAKKRGLQVPDFGTHNPLYDSRVVALVYLGLRGRTNWGL